MEGGKTAKHSRTLHYLQAKTIRKKGIRRQIKVRNSIRIIYFYIYIKEIIHEKPAAMVTIEKRMGRWWLLRAAAARTTTVKNEKKRYFRIISAYIIQVNVVINKKNDNENIALSFSFGTKEAKIVDMCFLKKEKNMVNKWEILLRFFSFVSNQLFLKR